MRPSEFQKKIQCPHCGESVRFNEIHTRRKLGAGQPKEKVAVFRCPKCKKIIGPIVPLDQQRV